MPKKETAHQEVTLNFRVEVDMHERLRKCSFDKRVPIAQICREGIEIILKKYEKNKK